MRPAVCSNCTCNFKCNCRLGQGWGGRSTTRGSGFGQEALKECIGTCRFPFGSPYWQELLHGGRYSESYTDSLPDFVKLAESYKAVGLRAKTTDELDNVINQMIETKNTVIADIWVTKEENCFPMIQSGSAHNEMLLSKDQKQDKKSAEKGKILV